MNDGYSEAMWNHKIFDFTNQIVQRKTIAFVPGPLQNDALEMFLADPVARQVGNWFLEKVRRLWLEY